jgi:hypothetical protein
MGRIFFQKRICLFIMATFSLLISGLVVGQSSENLDPLIEKYSSQYKLDKELVKSLIQISSGGNSRAVSQSGDKGLMQLTPEMIKNLGIQNPFNPEENIRGGCKYLKSLMDQFSDIKMSVAAFNAGPGQVQKYGKVPPNAETKKFVEAVMRSYESLKKTKTESDFYGSWEGTARFTKYVSKPPLVESMVGKTQPFDLQIIQYGSAVSLKTSKGQLGDPALYTVQLNKNKLHVEYKGPNPFMIPIPNTTTTHSMTFVLDVNLSEDILKGEFSSTVTSKVVYHIPDMKLPDGESEINYSMTLNLKRK